MVFQSYAVFPHMKVYDNIAFGLRMQKEKKAVIDERVRSSAELLHIEELLGRYRRIVRGPEQRVAVARDRDQGRRPADGRATRTSTRSSPGDASS